MTDLLVTSRWSIYIHMLHNHFLRSRTMKKLLKSWNGLKSTEKNNPIEPKIVTFVTIIFDVNIYIES